MMATTNDVTGDAIRTKAPSKKYRDNYEAIFSKDKQAQKNEWYRKYQTDTEKADDSSYDSQKIYVDTFKRGR